MECNYFLKYQEAMYMQINRLVPKLEHIYLWETLRSWSSVVYLGNLWDWQIPARKEYMGMLSPLALMIHLCFLQCCLNRLYFSVQKGKRKVDTKCKSRLYFKWAMFFNKWTNFNKNCLLCYKTNTLHITFSELVRFNILFMR